MWGLFFLAPQLFLSSVTPHTSSHPAAALVGIATQHKSVAKHVPNSETMQCVITGDSAIRWLAGPMCGPRVAGCGGEIGPSDRAQG